jgi:hypothetical protein
MTRVDGSLARNLDFDDVAANAGPAAISGRGARLRMAPATRLRGPDKYKVLDARRRHAQIKARRLLDLMGRQECGR